MAGLLRAGSAMLEELRRHVRVAVRFLEPHSQQEREKRAAHAFALLVVCAVAIVKYVTGVTLHDSPFTLYVFAVAASAAHGGFAPAVVATLASIVVAGPEGTAARLAFGAEGVFVALVVSAIRSRLERRESWLGAAGATIADLRLRDHHGRLLDAALRHLEESAGETAVIVLNELGTITEWRTGAERLYGYSPEQLVGTSGAVLFFEYPSADRLSALLHECEEAGSLRQIDVHKRCDGSRLDVEIEIKPFSLAEVRGFTLTVHDLARRHEWDDYRQAATHAQAALTQAADETRQQLAALENLTDPSLNPLGGAAMVTELLERLRAAVRADGAALVHRGRAGIGVVAARGLQPAGTTGLEGVELTPGRVAVVHNDPARVEQLSAVDWSPAVTSLLVVPVVYNGQVWSRIEVACERSRQVSDWDVALVRIVADRLAAVVVQDRILAARAS